MTESGQPQAGTKTLGVALPDELHTQYLLYLRNILTGKFGTSFFQKEPVFDVLMDVFPNTLLLTGTSLIVAYIFGVIGGALLAWRRGSALEGAGILVTYFSDGWKSAWSMWKPVLSAA